MALLAIRGLGKTFGSLRALDDVSLDVESGEFHGLIGPNGSGKSTLLKAIAGEHSPSSGTISFEGCEITGMAPARRAAIGLSIKFQITAVLGSLTVYDNVLLALQRGGSLSQLLLSRTRYSLDTSVMERLDAFNLTGHAGTVAGSLSHGAQQWLEIAMALATGPRLLLLDEPTAGMSLKERQATGSLLRGIKDKCAIVIVEHDLEFIKALCDRLTVLDGGRVLEQGTVAQIERSDRVKEIYTRRG